MEGGGCALPAGRPRPKGNPGGPSAHTQLGAIRHEGLSRLHGNEAPRCLRSMSLRMVGAGALCPCQPRGVLWRQEADPLAPEARDHRIGLGVRSTASSGYRIRYHGRPSMGDTLIEKDGPAREFYLIKRYGDFLRKAGYDPQTMLSLIHISEPTRPY